MANIIVPDIDKIWGSLPDTPLRPLDGVIEFLHKLEQGINPPDYPLSKSIVTCSFASALWRSSSLLILRIYAMS